MWKTVNSVYKSANKNIKKLGKNLPSISTVSQSIQKINIKKILPSKDKNPQSQLQKNMNEIFKNKKPVMPINKMSFIAGISYQNQNFDQICQMILQQIQVFKFESKFAKKTLNSLVLLSYLIKNGASGFVDQFREQMNIFEQHSQLSLQNAYISDDKQLQKLRLILPQIKQRSKYIMALLTDKKKLLKQKQIAMQIKRKIMQSSDKQNNRFGNSQNRNLMFNNMGDNLSQQNGNKSKKQKLQQFLQHYVWKYWNKFDQKMQNITQRIIQKIDEYLDMQQPQSFQIDQIQTQDKDKQSIKTQTNIEENVKIKEQKFLKQRNDLDIQIKEEKGPVLNTDLI